MYIVTRENMPRLGRSYLLKLISNMRSKEAKVRFGKLGEGKCPNYQVELPNGTLLTYRGINHKRDNERDRYEDAHLSDSFTFSEVEVAASGKAPTDTDQTDV